MPEETLNYMADRFIELRLHALTGVTFDHYLDDPEKYEGIAFMLLAGGGLNITHGVVRTINLH